MEQLRIHRLKYRNRGMADKALKGQQEHHVIFKFDTDEKAKNFIAKVKDFWYSLESVKDKVIDIMNDESKKTVESFDKLNEALNGLKKDEKTEVAKPPIRKRPGPQKGKGGRPAKANIQR